MAGDDDERTRIGGMPPPAVKPAAREPASPAVPAPEGGEGERTQIAPARPPAAPGAPAAPASAPQEPGERTQIAGGAPPRPVPPGAAAAPAASAGQSGEEGDRTRVVAGGPPGAPRAPSSSPAPSAAAPPPGPAAPAAPAPPVADVTVDPLRGRAGDDEERTVVLSRRIEATIRLRRVAPTGQAEVLTLDRPSAVFGRGHGCEVKLYTPTASREHARLFFQEGRWRITPLERKTLYLDGRRVSEGEVVLDNGVRIKLGDDELVVEDATGASPARVGGGGLWARVVGFLKGLVGRRG